MKPLTFVNDDDDDHDCYSEKMHEENLDFNCFGEDWNIVELLRQSIVEEWRLQAGCGFWDSDWTETLLVLL